MKHQKRDNDELKEIIIKYKNYMMKSKNKNVYDFQIYFYFLFFYITSVYKEIWKRSISNVK